MEYFLALGQIVQLDALRPFAHRVERQGDGHGRPHRQERVPGRTDRRPDADHHRRIDSGEERGEETVENGLPDDEVDVVEAVFEDGDRDR